MRICVSGTVNMGKSTYVNDFVKNWPMYTNAEITYRKILKEKNLPHSTKGTAETQTIIRDAIIDDISKYTRDDHVIFDRGLLDNLAYTLYLNEKGIINDDYVRDSIPIIREAMSYYDLIFYVPMLAAYPVEPENNDKNGARDLSPLFREEHDTILKELQRCYLTPKSKLTFFPDKNCPAIIEIFGTPAQRIEMTKFYVNPKGNVFGEEESLIINPFEKKRPEMTIESAGDLPVDVTNTYE